MREKCNRSMLLLEYGTFGWRRTPRIIRMCNICFSVSNSMRGEGQIIVLLEERNLKLCASARALCFIRNIHIYIICCYKNMKVVCSNIRC